MHHSTLRGLTHIVILFTIFALSCDSENTISEVSPLPTDYFPLTKGSYQIYQVNEVVYTLGTPAESSYQLKTVLVDSIDRGNGSYAHVQYHYKRATSSEGWTYLDTWSVQADARELVINEANTVFLKFRLPLNEGYTWNGNTYNNLDDDDYSFEGVRVSQEVGNTQYPDCLVINQEDNNDLVVFLDQRKEIYARNIGLISRDVRQLHYCTATESGCLGQQIVEEGIEYTQKLVSHGVE